MKNIKKYSSLILLTLIFSISYGQRENENWTFGKNKWTFNNSTGNLSTSTLNFNNQYLDAQYHGSATISDPLTGDLLFFTDGITIYNKNNQKMEGAGIYSTISSQENNILMSGLSTGNGLSAIQPAIIVPYPGNQKKYYVFFNGNYNERFSYSSSNNFLNKNNFSSKLLEEINTGLRVGIVDLNFNNGLGKLVLPEFNNNNNLLLDNITEALTSVKHADGKSYWIITQRAVGNQFKFYSYKISTSGLNTTPIISNAVSSSTMLKASPNGQLLFSGTSDANNSNVIYNFNNQTGIISSPNNFTEFEDNDYYTGVSTSYAEFSPNSKILYFIIGQRCLCFYPINKYQEIGIAMYNIETGELIGREFDLMSDFTKFPLSEEVASLQLSKNGKIYLTFSHIYSNDNYGYTNIKVSKTWATIDNPNIWNTSSSPITNYYNYNDNRSMSFAFPQLIPESPKCIENINIINPITSNQDFQVSNNISASSQITNNVTSHFKGKSIDLKPGFSINSEQLSLFSATLDPCNTSNSIITKNNNQFDKTIEEEAQSKLPILFPNPAINNITINNADNIINWSLVNIYGNTIKQGRKELYQNHFNINISNFPSGLYYFKATMKNGKLFQKTIIKN